MTLKYNILGLTKYQPQKSAKSTKLASYPLLTNQATVLVILTPQVDLDCLECYCHTVKNQSPDVLRASQSN